MKLGIIPDDILEECLNLAEESSNKFIENMKISISTPEEIRNILNTQYDIRLLNCLEQKNLAFKLKPKEKGDLTTTKIELRKAEYFKKCEEKFLK